MRDRTDARPPRMPTTHAILWRCAAAGGNIKASRATVRACVRAVMLGIPARRYVVHTHSHIRVRQSTQKKTKGFSLLLVLLFCVMIALVVVITCIDNRLFVSVPSIPPGMLAI